LKGAAPQPGPAAQQFSQIRTGRDFNVVGGDLNQQFGQDLPAIELDLGITAEPLNRLFHDRAEEDSWIERRKAHLIETLVPRRPDSSFPDVTRMWMESRDYNADRATFDTRLKEHLQEWRSELPKLVFRRIYESDHNKVVFSASNPTDVPIRNVELVARFKPGDALVLTSHPGREIIPTLPKWPDISDDFGWRHALGNNIGRMTAAYASPLAGGRRTRTDGDYLEITFLVGDIRAHRLAVTPAVTIIPRMAFDTHALDVVMTATAMDHRGAVEDRFVVAIKQAGFLLETVVKPEC